MAEVGADLETMRNLHTGLNQGADHAVQLKTTLDGNFQNTVWKGPNADKMRQAWDEFKPHLDKLHASLNEAKDDVRVQHNNIAHATGSPEQI